MLRRSGMRRESKTKPLKNNTHARPLTSIGGTPALRKKFVTSSDRGAFPYRNKTGRTIQVRSVLRTIADAIIFKLSKVKKDRLGVSSININQTNRGRDTPAM